MYICLKKTINLSVYTITYCSLRSKIINILKHSGSHEDRVLDTIVMNKDFFT